MKRLSVRAFLMLIPTSLSNSEMEIARSSQTSQGPHHQQQNNVLTKHKPTMVTHLDYVNDTGQPRGTLIDLRMRPHQVTAIEIPVSETPHFLRKFQETVDVSRK